MCFNISVKSKKNIIENHLDVRFEDDLIFEPQIHISAFTNPLIPVITARNRDKIKLYYWGLIPSWIKDKQKANEIRKMTYNAKSETVLEKPSFRDSINNRKCLVIADGFYEWQSTSNGKECYYITCSDNNIFTFAGLWSDWLDKSTGELLKSVSILTQPANEIMSKIHNIKKRQPVILHSHNQGKWLDSELNFQDIINESFNIKINYEKVHSPLKSI
tara:strand:- start:375 stop:1025 length:651 start_codon:yes stop_codon:yes gene_type:complete